MAGVTVTVAERATGHVIGLDGTKQRSGSGPSAERPFDTVDAALAYAREGARANPAFEYIVIDDAGEHVETVTHGPAPSSLTSELHVRSRRWDRRTAFSVAEALARAALPAVQTRAVRADASPLRRRGWAAWFRRPVATPCLFPTTSKLGGVPYASPVDETGDPMSFLAQLNFAEVPPTSGLPSRGILGIFSSPHAHIGLHATWDPDPQGDGAHVDHPPMVDFECRLEFESTWSLPMPSDVRALLGEAWSRRAESELTAWLEERFPGVGGHPFEDPRTSPLPVLCSRTPTGELRQVFRATFDAAGGPGFTVDVLESPERLAAGELDDPVLVLW